MKDNEKNKREGKIEEGKRRGGKQKGKNKKDKEKKKYKGRGTAEIQVGRHTLGNLS